MPIATYDKVAVFGAEEVSSPETAEEEIVPQESLFSLGSRTLKNSAKHVHQAVGCQLETAFSKVAPTSKATKRLQYTNYCGVDPPSPPPGT